MERRPAAFVDKNGIIVSFDPINEKENFLISRGDALWLVHKLIDLLALSPNSTANPKPN